MTKAMLDNQYFIAPVATIVNKETEKAVKVKSKREYLRWIFVAAAYSMGKRSSSSSDQPPTDISEELTYKKVYSII